jgi:thiamine kinase-like enzyme
VKRDQPQSLIELLHPETARSVQALQEMSLPLLKERAESGHVLIIAPSSLLRRAHVKRYLSRSGLRVAEIVWRGANGTSELRSIDQTALTFGPKGAGFGPLARFALAIVTRRPFAPLAAMVMPRVLLVAHAPSAPAARWLGVPAPTELPPAPSFVMSLSVDHDRAYVYWFAPEDGRPRAVTKIGLTDAGGERVAREAAALQIVASAAGVGDVEVPQLFHSTRIGTAPALVESFVDGATAATVIAGNPQRMMNLVDELARWLKHWGVATSGPAADRRAFVDATLLQPLESLAGYVPDEFVQAVNRGASHLLTVPLKATAAHNDLTMWNVLVRADGTLGVLDWEGATAAALPLADLFYAVADAAYAASGYVDRSEALRACFCADGKLAEWVRTLVKRHVEALDVGTDEVILSFRSCWLQHAADDVRRGRDQGFLGMLREVAYSPEAFWPIAGDGA